MIDLFSAPRFFAPGAPLSGEITLSGEQARHALRVLRLGKGDRLTVSDGAGREAACVITSASGGALTAMAEDVRVSPREPAVKVRLYPSLSKGERYEYTLQKATEIGVASITPVVSNRCVAALPEPPRLRRWRGIICEAAKQSRRAVLPELREAVTFPKAARLPVTGLRLFCCERESHPLGEILRGADIGGEVSILTGPEGGYTEEEEALAIGEGWLSVALGGLILRCETAPVAAAVAVLYAAGCI
ncbi:MAG: 16S rRNA (uracil(1498)-N(3))-methyltransferase [Oscillospiraceae bacterium]|jgi:16S rRNA (uracil1498-N3)-methyltransferase|nr:16S rRNA (uracil(1498)-N(3))-methyltransferase [Oscillospiraceae bacterium]